MTALEIPELSLVVLIGVTGAGKSTFAANNFRETEVLSSDRFRGLVADDPTSQEATGDAFEVLELVAGKRLAAGRLTVIDATSVRVEDRKRLVALARAHDVLPVAIVLDVPPDELRGRARDRTDITVGVVERQYAHLQRNRKGLRKEGFRHVHQLDGVADIDAATIVRTPLFSNLNDRHGPFDIIGDVHGCFTELTTLLGKVGWRLQTDTDGIVVGAVPPEPGRTAIFVGDLVDRGPDTPAVLRLVMSMVRDGSAFCVRGNHEDKLLRVLRQRSGRARDAQPIALTHGLAESMTQLDAQPPEFVREVVDFLDSLVSHYVFDDGRLVVAHAGLAEKYHGRASGRVRDKAMYGETTGETDRWGFPVRVDWAADYRGSARVVYGHTPVPDAAWINNTMCLDTGCVFGGRLTALHYPEMALSAVPAEQTYFDPGRPMGFGTTRADVRVRTSLNLSDVVGKRIIDTGFGPPITVREDNAATALEVMSRYAVDPRWIRYLPPTMAPVSPGRADLLEDPRAAFESYAQRGVSQVVCEEKHMGSRAIIVVAKDESAAAQAFGVTQGSGAIYTRTGRSFFDPTITEQLIVRIRRACAELFDQLDSDWLILDAELLPWNVKGEGLIRDQFASVAAAAGPELRALGAELARAADRGLDVQTMIDANTKRRADVEAYTDAYLRYVDVDARPDTVSLAPFEVLASAASEYGGSSHGWHLEVAARLAAADPVLFRPTRHIVVDTGSETSCLEGARWWEDLTAAGSEGMVVKPAGNVTRVGGKLIDPGVKVRGREYLRMVYGPSYLDDLPNLRSRDLRHKRSMAMREYQLGREALARQARSEPLWRIHECVFAILALESEPVDPRL